MANTYRLLVFFMFFARSQRAHCHIHLPFNGSQEGKLAWNSAFKKLRSFSQDAIFKKIASSLITSWQIEGDTVEAVTDIMFLGSKSLRTVTGAGLFAKLCPTLATPKIVACQAILPMGFSSEEYWSGLLFPSPGCWLKNGVQLESCELSFIWGKMRPAALEAASQTALKSQYIRFWWRGVQYHEALNLQTVFVSHEGLMSTWRELVLL